MKESLLNMRELKKLKDAYQRTFSESPPLMFNVHLRDKYGTYIELLAACLKAGKTVKQLEPVRSAIET